MTVIMNSGQRRGFMEEIIKYIKKRNGYASMNELKESGFQTRHISECVREGTLEKVKPGLYRLSDSGFYKNVNLGFTDVCRAVPRGVICLGSAVNYYGLSTYNPAEIHVAVLNSDKAVKIYFPPVKFYFFRNEQYTNGIKTIKTIFGDIRIYEIEKTVCDMFRFRNILGEDIALESLRSYIKRKDADFYKLRNFSIACRVASIITPYLKGLVG